ncbi:MAG TPA: hypothetical protein VFI22_16965 [Thermomicrobiales bacterium]|nr:hypothetical protein [Thermomicrobiales bacterium]
MRASYIRRGLVALAAAGMISVGVAGAVSAQSYADDNGALSVIPTAGYNSTLVHPGSHPASVILASNGMGDVPLAVQFIPDLNGATVLTPGVSILNAPKQ